MSISNSGSILKVNAEKKNSFEVILHILLKFVLYLEITVIETGYSISLKALQQLSYQNTQNF